MHLADFANHESSKLAGLSAAHVAALRIYTTAAYTILNSQMRSQLSRSTVSGTVTLSPHPLPITMGLINEAIRRLRVVEAASDTANTCQDLWRGVRDVYVPEHFLSDGGTDCALMSTTTKLAVALRYAIASNSQKVLLLKFRSDSFMDRGANLAFLSAFPEEAEILFPPLTYMKPPTGGSLHESFTIGQTDYTVIEMLPVFGT